MTTVQRIILEIEVDDFRSASSIINDSLQVLNRSLIASHSGHLKSFDLDAQYVTLEQACEYLEEIRQLDKELFARILETRVGCDDTIESHLTLLVVNGFFDGQRFYKYATSVLGLINGMLTRNTNHKGAISCVFDETDAISEDDPPMIVRQNLVPSDNNKM